MNESFKLNSGIKKVFYDDSITALKRHCESLLNIYSDIEKEHLTSLGKVCKSRSTYRFKFPNIAQILYKYMTKSQEFNLLRVIDAGSGRKGTTYGFDYTYCVLQEIPTHYLKGTEKVDKQRSLKTGEWVTKITNINNEIIAQSEIPSKIEGEISFLHSESGNGFIKSETGEVFFSSKQYIIQADLNKNIWHGEKMRFNPSLWGDTKLATEIEIL